MWRAVCLNQSHAHVELIASETLRLWRKSVKSIFSIRIWVTRELSTFVNRLCAFSRFLLISCCWVTMNTRLKICLYRVQYLCHSLSCMFLMILLCSRTSTAYFFLSALWFSVGSSHERIEMSGFWYDLVVGVAQIALRVPGVRPTFLRRPLASLSFSAIILQDFYLMYIFASTKRFKISLISDREYRFLMIIAFNSR